MALRGDELTDMGGSNNVQNYKCGKVTCDQTANFHAEIEITDATWAPVSLQALIRKAWMAVTALPWKMQNNIVTW